MKIMFASDIHGSAYYCRKMLDAYEASGAERLVLLGDILYHGPRNDLPREIYAVRGNCDTEVDQMVLNFPILADYGLFVLEGKTFYATHGHVFNQDHLPPMQAGDILIHGHTHVLRADRIQAEGIGEITILNPGSTSIPKEGNPPTYAILEDGMFRILTFEGETVKETAL